MPLPKTLRPFHYKPWDKALIEASYTDIQVWNRGYFDISLTPWQRYFFHYPVKDKMGIAGIRSGKSFESGDALLWFAQTHEHSRCLNACISSEQAKIIYNDVIDLATRPRFQHWIESVERSPYPLIRLINGSEIWFRSTGYQATLLRGYQFDFINVDECAYITDEETIKTLKGRLLGVNNKLDNRPLEGWFWQMSSPKGKGTWVFDRWKKGDPQYADAETAKYLSLRIRTVDNTLLRQSDIAELMASYTERQIRQELLGEFVDSDDVVFRYDQVMYACSEAHQEVLEILDKITKQQQRGEPSKKKIVLAPDDKHQTGDLTFYALPPEPGHKYLNVWDLGKKTTEEGRNASVGMVIDITDVPWQLVAYRYAPNQPYMATVAQIDEWDKLYSQGAKVTTITDSTGPGDVVQEVLESERNLKIDGLVITGANKADIINAGIIAFERGRFRFPFIKRFVDQLDIYERDDHKIPQDTVMCYCMAMFRAHQIAGLTLARGMDAFKAQGLSGLERTNFRRTPRLTRAHQRFIDRRRSAH